MLNRFVEYFPQVLSETFALSLLMLARAAVRRLLPVLPSYAATP